MQKFRYKAIRSDGHILNGEMTASSQGAAIKHLQDTGHLPVFAEPLSNKELLTQGKSIKHTHIVAWTRELATLMEAKLPLSEILHTLSESNQTTSLQQLAGRLYERLRAGKTLSQALEEDAISFGSLYLNMVRAGEVSGNLEMIIGRLAEHLEKNAEFRNYIISVLIYPVILLIFVVVSITALMLFIIPQFIPLFADSGQALPLITQLVFAISGHAKTILAGFLLLGGIATVIVYYNKNNVAWKQRLDAISLHLPLVGPLIIKLNLARFARILGILLQSGVPILNAVHDASRLLNNSLLQEKMEAACCILEKGGRFVDVMQQSQYIPNLFVQIVRTSEASGQLDTALIRIANIYEQETQLTIKRMLALLEPLLILGLGLLIAVVIFSTLVAIMGLNELVI